MPPEPHARPSGEIRFYVDEDILGLGYAMMWLLPDAATCGTDPVAGELPRGIVDVDWIPRVAAHGWIAITKNHKIRTNPEEARVCLEAGARIVGFARRLGAMNSWQLITVLTRHWGAIETQATLPGPWWLSISASGTRLLEYSVPDEQPGGGRA